MYSSNNAPVKCKKAEIPLELRITTLTNQIKLKIERNKASILKHKNKPDYDSAEEIFKLTNDNSSYEEILKIPLKDEDDLAFAKWLYNRGDLRDEEEIKIKNEEIIKEKEQRRIQAIKQSDKYKLTYHPFLAFVFFTFFNIFFWSNVVGGSDAFKGFFEFMAIAAYTASIPVFLPPCILTYLYICVHNSFYDLEPDTDDFGYIAVASIAGCASTYIGHKSNAKNKGSSKMTV